MTATDPQTSVDPTQLDSWIRIRPDNTVAVWSGVAEFGQGSVSTAFRQIVAEELRVPFEAVTELVTGDTDRTPGGGIAAGTMNKAVQEHFMGGEGLHPDSPFGRTALNLQKVAAYAYAELLERGSHALGVPVDGLTVADGVVRSSSCSVTYAELVRDDPLDLRLEISGSAEGMGMAVLGTPPIVQVSDYRVIGTSCPNPQIPLIVEGRAPWAADVTVPGMLHGRIVHPRTLGSTLVSVGELDPTEHPNAEVIVRGNLVGVVAPDEWEAIEAAQAVAATTVWSDWSGLPRSDRLVEAMLETDWSKVPPGGVTADRERVEASLEAAPRRLDSTFALPFYKHAPIGPEVVVADVRADGTAHLWLSSQQLQKLRGNIATILGIDPDNVVVHFAQGAGGFGRTTGGDAGAEAEAAILSQACVRPVRLQWTREEDFAWSTQHAPYLGEVSVGLDDEGRMTSFVARHHLAGSNDPRLLGALLAGVSAETLPPIGVYLNNSWVEWPYDRVANRVEVGHGADNIGQAASPIEVGLRHRSMRSPMHLQQNFAVESMVSEAAAAAGADPIQFRIDHTTDARLIGVLEKVREMSGWETRPSPAPSARRTGGGVVRGRGVGLVIRHGGYFAGVAEIAVDLETGAVSVERYWLAAEVGVVVNPTLLRSNLEGGSVMGISQALHEELQFDGSAITSTDFRSYPILTMAEMPELEVEILDRRDLLVVGQASEPPNMVPPVALTGAFFDATGVPMRRLPLRPEYVRAELAG
jgi:CO/xanthine dehydrogenase Mo-binding subunit